MDDSLPSIKRVSLLPILKGMTHLRVLSMGIFQGHYFLEHYADNLNYSEPYLVNLETLEIQLSKSLNVRTKIVMNRKLRSCLDYTVMMDPNEDALKRIDTCKATIETLKNFKKDKYLLSTSQKRAFVKDYLRLIYTNTSKMEMKMSNFRRGVSAADSRPQGLYEKQKQQIYVKTDLDLLLTRNSKPFVVDFQKDMESIATQRTLRSKKEEIKKLITDIEKDTGQDILNHVTDEALQELCDSITDDELRHMILTRVNQRDLRRWPYKKNGLSGNRITSGPIGPRFGSWTYRTPRFGSP